MQSGLPPNLANLNQLFNQYDSNHDGLVNDQQIQSILKDIGYTDVYIGTIRKIIRLLNIEDPQNKALNYLQVMEYAEAMTTKGKFKVWKAKWQINETLSDTIRDLYENQEDQAAPGASPTGAPGSHSQKEVTSQQGEISVNIGNTSNFNQYINFALEKQKGQQRNYLTQLQVKPFVNITVERNSNNEAKQLQTLFKSIYEKIIEIIKSEEEQLISEILSVSFDTKVNGNIFILNVSTENKGLIELAQQLSEYLDSLLKVPINGKIQGSYKFSFDFQKFLSVSNYNFYDMIVNNCMIHLKWNIWDLFQNLRKILIKTDAFSELKYDSTQPFSLFLIGLLHCQKFTGRLQFESTSSLNQELSSKEEIINVIKDMKEGLNNIEQDSSLGLLQLLEHLDGKISIEGGVKDWKFNIETKLLNLSKLFLEDFQPKDENDDEDHNSNLSDGSSASDQQAPNIHAPQVGLKENGQSPSNLEKCVKQNKQEKQ